MAVGTWRGLRKTLLKRQVYDPARVEETNLKRCLNRWDLHFLGVGSTLGIGVYVIVGYVALNLAGPSVVLSFLIAAVAALFAALCYAEFGARIPKAGGAYSYTYLAIGEVVAFIVGWNNILENMSAAASIARGLSVHINVIFNMTMSNWFTSIAPITISFISPYFDFFACLIVLIMGMLLSFGVREVCTVNNLIVAANVLFVLFIIFVGAFAASINNWSIPIEEVPPDNGVGGFFPYGVWGTLEGAAVSLFAFVGIDSICAAGEEVKNPRRAIPLTILSVLGITFLCYTGVSIVFTMMVPYYIQNLVITVPNAFLHVGWKWARWVVCVGTLFGMYASLFGAMFPLTRVMYAMSSDGLLASFLSKLTTSRQSPALVTIGTTVIIALFAGLLQITTLLLMTSIGTLLSYTAVAASVVILRYGSDYTPGKPRYLRQLFGIGRSPTLASSRIVNACLLLFICIIISHALVLMYVQNAFIPCITLNAVALVLLLFMTIQPTVKEDIYFKTPLVPLVPCLSIYINIHLMVFISVHNWIITGIWTIIGLVIYLLTVLCCRKSKNKLGNNVTMTLKNSLTRNGKSTVQIVVESPTPPDTLNRISDYAGELQNERSIQEDIKTIVRNDIPIRIEEITLHQAYIENNGEKEAKIIDLLDQVLQAEEDSYGDGAIKEEKDDNVCSTENVQRKSLSELSDAGSDASLGIQGLSKYDVIAQVHREDLPRVNEEEEKSDREDIVDNNEIDDSEEVTAFNDSETNSRTDESGYSDTIDRNTLSESFDESKESIFIPAPPPLPLDDNFIIVPDNEKANTTVDNKDISPETRREENLNIPLPPPLPSDEKFFKSPLDENFVIIPINRKANTSPKHGASASSLTDDEVNKSRESIISNQSMSSLNNCNLAFGSDRQIHFMFKLNDILQNKIAHSDEEEPRQRSRSAGNVAENLDFTMSRERSPMFLALKEEILFKEVADKLHSANANEIEVAVKNSEPLEESQSIEEIEDITLSKKELKSKLENIFAAGGPQLLKPRLIKSNAPEDSCQTDTSSTESIPKLSKIEKNDTLKRQKDKFSAVLNSIRLSYKDEAV